MTEIWKDVSEFEGLYEVSNLGRVRSIDRIIVRRNGILLPLRGKILLQYEKYGNSTIPRLQVNLSKEGKCYSKTVSRLVAKAFIPNPDNLPQVNHKDENPANNCVDNLEWCTGAYNHNYGTRNERHAQKLKKQVDMFTLKHEFIKRYNSIKEAAEDIDGDPSAITKVCKGKNQNYKNYIFTYVS